MRTNLAEKIIGFLSSLHIDIPAQTNVHVLNPYREQTVLNLCRTFYQKYYPDLQPRTLILGINPGRFGGGLTGIPFTDPARLEQACQIANELPKRTELSSDFIYRVIARWGSPKTFYQHFYVGSVCPLGFVHNGKNLNYYDLPWLEQTVTPFIEHSLQAQLEWGFNREVAFCLGTGKNLTFLTKLNNRRKFFKTIIPLPHPRFVMQYQRRKIEENVQLYIDQLQSALG